MKLIARMTVRAGRIVYDPSGLSMVQWEKARSQYFTTPALDQLATSEGRRLSQGMTGPSFAGEFGLVYDSAGVQKAFASRLNLRILNGDSQTMKTIQGPAIFLAQFAGDAAPFNTLDNIAGWAAGLGYKGVQIPILGCAHV